MGSAPNYRAIVAESRPGVIGIETTGVSKNDLYAVVLPAS
jgi:hypothetical protein